MRTTRGDAWKAAVQALVVGGRAALPALRVHLRDHPSRGVREGIAHAIGDWAPADAETVAVLMEALDDRDDFVRWKAVRALGNIGPPARAALDRIRLIAEKDQEIMRASAERALVQIAGEAR